MRRVVITGMGALTPLGKTVEEFWNNLIEGKSGIRKIDRFDTSNLKTQIAGLIPENFDPLERLDKKEAGVPINKLDRFSTYTLYASAEAIEDAKLYNVNPDRIGVIIASGIGGIETLVNEIKVSLEKGYDRVSPYLIPMMIPDMASGLVSIKYKFKGPNFCTVSACSSSAHAIGEAYRLIKYGDADIIVAGGSEAPIIPIAISGFNQIRALSTRNDEPQKASRPFDKLRDGFVMGEGAGIVVLEELEHAIKRGARIYAEIVGYGQSADAYHITAPCVDGEGAIKCMLNAIKDAKVDISEISYINAHGTSTELNDKSETLAIKSVFKEYAYKIPISSTKSMIGHLLGAAGVVESIAVIKSIQTGIIHPTINYEVPDPECDLDYVPNVKRNSEIRYALKNSFGFGGHNVSLVFKKFED
ncbi:MAG: beta-ketoacyl-ACP synthase II [candidate division WOR-3 bacterium]|nr:beta-ketoacyl-ACP synthase II [candidate division WOR-3 bacterium]MCX7947139.1 beta-ketoacyl-ACP synthase II [candidate division WOR-3 bacterium]MDW8149819.1 beta-ketoacyl-ACP synthase II [candidate division WOR-3 bacterium]